MNNFTEQLKNQNIASGEKLEPEALIVAQKVLFGMGLEGIPQSYADFLKQYNGVKANGAYLFGATVDDELDIIDCNEQISKPEKTLLLGYNDLDLLVFNFITKQYQIVDREDMKVLDSYPESEIDYALAQIFNI